MWLLRCYRQLEQLRIWCSRHVSTIRQRRVHSTATIKILLLVWNNKIILWYRQIEVFRRKQPLYSAHFDPGADIFSFLLETTLTVGSTSIGVVKLARCSLGTMESPRGRVPPSPWSTSSNIAKSSNWLCPCYTVLCTCCTITLRRCYWRKLSLRWLGVVFFYQQCLSNTTRTEPRIGCPHHIAEFVYVITYQQRHVVLVPR